MYIILYRWVHRTVSVYIISIRVVSSYHICVRLQSFISVRANDLYQCFAESMYFIPCMPSFWILVDSSWQHCVLFRFLKLLFYYFLNKIKRCVPYHFFFCFCVFQVRNVTKKARKVIINPWTRTLISFDLIFFFLRSEWYAANKTEIWLRDSCCVSLLICIACYLVVLLFDGFVVWWSLMFSRSSVSWLFGSPTHVWRRGALR